MTYESFFHITKTSIMCHIINNFGKTVNLNFNGLTGDNSLCYIHQIYLRNVKLSIPTKNGILSNFDLHGWPSKSDIFWVMAVANSQICTVSSGYPKIREFVTAITQNISHLEGHPCESKLLRMSFLVRLVSLIVLR